MVLLPIETDRLLLREFHEEDWQDIHEYAADPEVVKHMPWGPNTEDESRDFLSRQHRGITEEPRLEWNIGIELLTERRIIGGISLRVTPPNEFFAEPKGNGEIGYVLNRNYWRKGIMTEAANAVIKWGFESFDISKIWASADMRNAQSHRVLEKLGMRHSETRPSQLSDRLGNSVVEVVYEMLRTEWEAGGAG